MTTASLPLSRPAFDVSRYVQTGALVALLDGVFAVVFYVPLLHKTTAVRLFQGIAASLIGRDAAFAGGIQTCLVGVLMHIGVAFGWTTVFVIAYRQSDALKALVRNTTGMVLTGFAYGCLIWLMMEYVIVQFTRTPPGHVAWTWIFCAMLAWHAVGIGLPIVAMTRRQ